LFTVNEMLLIAFIGPKLFDKAFTLTISVDITFFFMQVSKKKNVCKEKRPRCLRGLFLFVRISSLVPI